jgi:hypothetical protein
MGVEAQDRAAFNRVAKENLWKIFSADATADIMANFRQVLAADAQLARYTAAL